MKRKGLKSTKKVKKKKRKTKRKIKKKSKVKKASNQTFGFSSTQLLPRKVLNENNFVVDIEREVEGTLQKFSKTIIFRDDSIITNKIEEPYDVIIDIGDCNSEKDTTWKVKDNFAICSHEHNVFTPKTAEDTYIVAPITCGLLGRYGCGKSYVLSRLADIKTPFEKTIETKGISMRYIDVDGTPVEIVDFPGFGEPIKAQFETNSKNSHQSEFFEQMITKKEKKEDFVYQTILDVSDVQIIVVGILTLQEQLMIERTKRFVQNEKKSKQTHELLLILHNYKDISEKQEFERKCKKEVLRYNDSGKAQIIRCSEHGVVDEEIMIYTEIFNPSIGKTPTENEKMKNVKVLHFFIGREGCDSGKNNKHVFHYLRKIISAKKLLPNMQDTDGETPIQEGKREDRDEKGFFESEKNLKIGNGGKNGKQEEVESFLKRMETVMKKNIGMYVSGLHPLKPIEYHIKEGDDRFFKLTRNPSQTPISIILPEITIPNTVEDDIVEKTVVEFESKSTSIDSNEIATESFESEVSGEFDYNTMQYTNGNFSVDVDVGIRQNRFLVMIDAPGVNPNSLKHLTTKPIPVSTYNTNPTSKRSKKEKTEKNVKKFKYNMWNPNGNYTEDVMYVKFYIDTTERNLMIFMMRRKSFLNHYSPSGEKEYPSERRFGVLNRNIDIPVEYNIRDVSVSIIRGGVLKFCFPNLIEHEGEDEGEYE